MFLGETGPKRLNKKATLLDNSPLQWHQTAKSRSRELEGE
jgi:hypothetical protein